MKYNKNLHRYNAVQQEVSKYIKKAGLESTRSGFLEVVDDIYQDVRDMNITEAREYARNYLMVEFPHDPKVGRPLKYDIERMGLLFSEMYYMFGDTIIMKLPDLPDIVYSVDFRGVGLEPIIMVDREELYALWTDQYLPIFRSWEEEYLGTKLESGDLAIETLGIHKTDGVYVITFAALRIDFLAAMNPDVPGPGEPPEAEPIEYEPELPEEREPILPDFSLDEIAAEIAGEIMKPKKPTRPEPEIQKEIQLEKQREKTALAQEKVLNAKLKLIEKLEKLGMSPEEIRKQL